MIFDFFFSNLHSDLDLPVVQIITIKQKNSFKNWFADICLVHSRISLQKMRPLISSKKKNAILNIKKEHLLFEVKTGQLCRN